MNIDVILGLQWGDEGKGKIVDYLAERYDVVARFQGGPNAGHTLVFDGKKYVLHTIPSGVFRENLINLVGNGVVIDPILFEKELKNLDTAGVKYAERLFLSQKAHLILPTHRLLDAASEKAKGKSKIGSTLRGIGPTYMDRTGRNGLRVGDINRDDFQERYERLKQKHLAILTSLPKVDFDLEAEEKQWFESMKSLRAIRQVNSEYFVNRCIKNGKRILAEGAQGSMLDVDFGTYPFVTSSNTVTAGVCIGLGVSPDKIGEVIGITKAYCTRVGSGPFPSELFDEMGEQLRKEGQEFGATTGRPRRCGWIDLPQLKYTIMLNGVTQLVLTKIDVLNIFKELKVGTAYIIDGKETEEVPYEIPEKLDMTFTSHKGWEQSLADVTCFEELPAAAKEYVNILEKELGVPITMVSTGPDRVELITRNI
ncbi:MAG: adenylosuccinate synthase [Maribacter sp.]|jgi:adenylosuccinate synthase